MFGAGWHNHHLAGSEPLGPVFKIDLEYAFDNQEQLIRTGMMVPVIFALQLAQANFIVVEPRHDLRRPLL
jgi:hypothetical protein